MESKRTFHRIVWAVDPYAEDTDFQRRVAETIRAITQGTQTEVEPVSVVHENTPTTKSMETFGLPSLAPVPLVQTDLSLSHAVLRFLQHAEKTSADLIVVGTQSRKGATRFLLGSFAETLILQSPIPTLIVSPTSRPVEKIHRIIFPTDLSSKSKSSFSQVIRFAKDVSATILLFHRMLPGQSKHELENFAAIARAAGVNTEIKVQESGESTVESIAKLSEQPNAIVAMVSRTQAIESILLGSTTRQVIRRAHCPVWVLHPHVERKEP